MHLARLVLLLCLSAAPACDRGGAPADPYAIGLAETPPSEARQQDSYRQPGRLVAALGLRPGQRVAEIGAGAGYLSLRLLRALGPTGSLLATDIDAEALAALRRRAHAAGLLRLETRTVQRDAPQLEPGRYDVIFLSQVDHLLPDRCPYLRQLLPALAPGGKIAISNSARFHAALMGCLATLPVRVDPQPVALPNQYLVFLHPNS